MVDDLNPVLTFTRREVESLLHFVEEEPDPAESAKMLQPQEDMELVISQACQRYPHLITKVTTHNNYRHTHRHTHRQFTYTSGAEQVLLKATFLSFVALS